MNSYQWFHSICIAVAACLFIGSPALTHAQDQGDTTITLTIKVTGEDGNPVPHSEVSAVPTSVQQMQLPRWHDVPASGVAKIERGGKAYRSYTVMARSPGYTNKVVSIKDNLDEVKNVVLERGKEVKLQLLPEDGRPIPPDLRPSVFPYNNAFLTCFSSSFSRSRTSPEGNQAVDMFSVESKGDGLYSTNIDTASTESLYAIISYAGFLRSHIAGPFDPQEWATSGTVTVHLPKPAAIAVGLDLGANQPDSEVVTMRLFQTLNIPGRGPTGVDVVTRELPVTSATVMADDLAPGAYLASAVMAPKKNQYSRDAKVVKQSVRLDSGDSHTLTLNYVPFNKEWLQGPYTAVLTLQDVQGKPAAGKPYKITWSESNHPKQTIAQGTVPSDGKVRIEGLAGVEKESTRDDYAKLGGVPTFDVEVDGHNVGYIFFGEARQGKLFPPDEGNVKDYTFHIPPQVGDLAPDFAMVNLETSETIRLSDLKGQVVLLDFWATWCGPCQPVMAENQKIVQKNADAWKGKATILALSIDDDQDSVRKHLEKNGWNHTLNTWSPPPADDPDKTGWDSPAPELYGINSIPTVLLIDKDGVIKERGHITDVEKKIQEMLQ